MGCWKVEKPRWFALVFRTVGLMGDGEMMRVDLRAWLVDEVGTVRVLRASFGLAARASMMDFEGGVLGGGVLVEWLKNATKVTTARRRREQ